MPIFKWALLSRIACEDRSYPLVVQQRNANGASQRRREARRHLYEIEMGVGVHRDLLIGGAPASDSLTEPNDQAWQQVM